MSSTIGKRIGEALILGVFLVVDVIDQWPKSHFTCLLLAVFGITGLVLLDGLFEKELPIKRTLLTASITTAACTIIYFTAPYLAESPRETEVIGTLLPGSDPDPKNTCPNTTSPDAWKIMIGTAAYQFAEPIDFPFLAVGKCAVLSITKATNGVSVAADLFDARGRLIANIKNNEFHALSGDHSRVERDHDLSKLIVLDGNGAEILYVHYMNRSTVRVRGVFGCPGYSMLTIKDNEPVPGIRMTDGVCGNVLKGVKFTKAFIVAD